MNLVSRRAAGCIVLRDGPEREVLLFQTPGNKDPRLPKGGVEPGESDEAAAVRETLEETGHQVTIVDPEPVIVRTVRTKKEPFVELTIRFYLAESKTDVPAAPISQHESEGAVFIPVNEALRLLRFPEEIEALSRMLIRSRVGKRTGEETF